MTLKLLATILFAVITATGTAPHVYAQSRPMPPLNPASQKECNEFIRAYKAYLDALHTKYVNCSRANSSVSVRLYQPAFRCSAAQSGQNVKVAPACVTPNNEWDCAIQDLKRQTSQCSAAAQKNEQEVAERNSRNMDDSLRKVMLDTSAGVPRAAAGATARLAKWWAEQTNSSNVSAVLKASETSGYGRMANSIKTILDSTKDPVTRAEQLTLLFNRNGNLISREMTATAIRGAARTGREAIAALDAEFNRFDLELKTEIENSLNKRDIEREEPRASTCAPGNATRAGTCCGEGYFPSSNGYNCYPVQNRGRPGWN